MVPLQKVLTENESRALLSEVFTTTPITDRNRLLLDYPNIKYVTKAEFTAQKAQKKANTTYTGISTDLDRTKPKRGTENIMGQFVEDEDGRVITAEEFNQIRMYSRGILMFLSNLGYLEPQWSNVDGLAQDIYVYKMVKQFPFLRLGLYNWKVYQILQDQYPSWYGQHHEKEDTQDELELPPAKRRRTQTLRSSTATGSQHNANVTDVTTPTVQLQPLEHASPSIPPSHHANQPLSANVHANTDLRLQSSVVELQEPSEPTSAQHEESGDVGTPGGISLTDPL